MKAVGYTRVSTQEQVKEGMSLEMQTHKIMQYAGLHEMDLVEIISDEGISAKSIDGRPGVLRVLHLVTSRQVDAVVVFKLDRLARNTREALDVAELMRKKNVGLHSITEKLDTESAIGEFFFTLMASLAQMERKLTGERIRAILHRKRERNEKTGGECPYGYRAVPSLENGKMVQKLVPVIHEQEMVRRVKELRRGGHTLRNVISILGAEGFHLRKGKSFSTAVIGRIPAA